MKKLKLKALELGASEILTRDQLKSVLGGDGSDEASALCHGASEDCSWYDIVAKVNRDGTCFTIKGTGMHIDVCGCKDANGNQIDLTDCELGN